MSWLASLPSHAPTVVCQNTNFVRDPEKILPVVKDERKREFNALIRRYIHQLLHGCQRERCDTLTCWTSRKRRKGCRELTPLSARIIAAQLATADDPYMDLCPGVPVAIVGRLVGDRVDQGLKDPRSFMQQLFDTIPLRKLEWLGLPLPSGILNFAPEDKGNNGDDDELPQTVQLPPTKLLQDSPEPKKQDGKQGNGKPDDIQVETVTPQHQQVNSVVTLSMSISPDPTGQTPQQSQHFSAYFTTPHHLRTPQSPPPHIRKYGRQKSYNDDKNPSDYNPLSFPPPHHHHHHSKSVPPNGRATPTPQGNMPPLPPHPPPPPRHRDHRDKDSPNNSHLHRTQSTPSKVHTPRDGSSSLDSTADIASPTSTVGDTYTVPPQSVTHFSYDIMVGLVKMCEDRTVGSAARSEAQVFVKQSIWYVFTTPEAIDKCFVLRSGPRDEIFNMHPSNIDSALRALLGRRWSNDVFHALWKVLDPLFPTILKEPESQRAAKAAKGMAGSPKLVRPSSIPEKVAAKIVIVVLHALAAFLPKAAPDIWEEARKVRSRGEISHGILIEDELGMRLICRLVRALSSYRLFAPGIMAHLQHYFSFCGVVSEKERIERLSRELGKDLGAEVAASRIGRGGWSLAVSTLEWVRSALLAEWDGEEKLRRGSVTEGAVMMMKFLFDNHEPFGLDALYFQNQILADRLDAKDVPVEWYLSSVKSISRSHLLSHPYLFPPSSLVTFFRSINFHIMSDSYDTAVTNHRLIHYISNTVEVQKFLIDSLYKRSKISMTPYLLLEVHRETVLKDALDQIIGRELRECSRPLKVRFLDVGEEGVDHGGVQQEFFSVLWTEILKAEYGIFTTDATTRLSWFSITTLEPLHKIELLGILVSLAVYNGVTLPISFPRAFYRKLLGYPVTDIEHIEDGWPELAKGLRMLLKWDEADGDVADIFLRGYEFSYEAWGKVWNIDMLRIKREDAWRPVMAPKAQVHVVDDGGKKDDDCPQLPEDIVNFSDTDDENGKLGMGPVEEPEVIESGPGFKVHEDPDAAEAPTEEEAGEVNGWILTESALSSGRGSRDIQPEISGQENSAESEEAEVVTNETREEFVFDYIFWLTDKSIRRQFEAFERGFRACLDPMALSLFTPASLQHLVEGSRDIDVAALEAAARYDDGYSPSHKLIRDFWSIVRSYGPERKRQLLEFVTASDRVPVNGIGNVMFVIQRNGPDSERVPTSLTCFGRLLLPEYNSKRKLREKLRLALENGKGFGVP